MLKTRTHRALSVKQPWATLIARGEKMAEFRSRATSYRGRLVIVSSKEPDENAPESLFRTRPGTGIFGCAIAVTRIADCVPADPERHRRIPGFAGQEFAWLLDRPRLIEPFPVTGQLGIYEIDVPTAPRRCRVCLCTEDFGCPGGIGNPSCSWAGPDYCTSCETAVRLGRG